MIERYDTLENYCRRLGDCVPFKYCRSMNARLPCSAILDCWYHRLPVQEFIGAHYSREQAGKIFAASKDKVQTLAEIAARVQRGQG